MSAHTTPECSPVLTSISAIELAPRSPRKKLIKEFWTSTELLFANKIMWLLVLGPVALLGDATGLLGEAACFACSGIALIPCAERLSFVTEQVALHTNETIGALLNATFGNAPELLISTAALRAGFYRVVQLAMLGSMLTNLLFVFGVSCLIGGLRWQVQELRITSGNVSTGMLLAATAGLLLPAAIIMGGELRSDNDVADDQDSSSSTLSGELPSHNVLQFSRVNAFVMMTLYLCYLIFQLGTHKEEFDAEENIVEAHGHMLVLEPAFTARSHGHGRHKRQAQRNLFCLRIWQRGATDQQYRKMSDGDALHHSGGLHQSGSTLSNNSNNDDREAQVGIMYSPNAKSVPPPMNEYSPFAPDSLSLPDFKRRRHHGDKIGPSESFNSGAASRTPKVDPVPQLPTDKSKDSEVQFGSDSSDEDDEEDAAKDGQMSLRAGILWLSIITLCISALSDILVDSIGGFAYRCHISEVFTSMVIIPFFSNIAEQVSAIIFAYHNKMDLCVGVTVGSAIQIALFVLPGCVLIGMVVDRSMSLYFRGYETCCLFLGVICVAAVLQGGTTNWLSGITLMAIYIMVAAGIWFHEIEDLSTDAELAIHNRTLSG